MASLVNHKTVTYEEWLIMPAVQNGREEAVNGEIRLMLPNKTPHPYVEANLVAAFLRQLEVSRFWVLSGSFGLVIRKEPLTCRNPDVAVFARANLVEKDGYFHSSPELAVEILSPTETRMMIEEKLRDYERIGTPEVWLVCPEAATVEVLHLESGKLRRSTIVADGSLRPLQLSGVAIEVMKIWPE